MKNDKYWKARFENLQKALLSQGEDYYKSLEEIYNATLDEINETALKWYIRFAKNNDITPSEANKWLTKNELKEFRWTVKEYAQRAKESGLNGKWLKELENASARVHIKRLEALELQLRQMIEELYHEQSIGISDTLSQVYRDGYYHTTYEIQRGLEVGSMVQALDPVRVSKVLASPWTADGLEFSARIWKQRDELVQVLHKELTQNMIIGNPPDKLIERIAKQFNTSKSKAGRLVMTESAFFACESQRNCYKDLDVKKYKISATLDLKTSEICRNMDGKVFKMSEYQAGLTAPPFHPWCRSCTVPYFSDYVGERIARGEDGSTYYVPGDITYKEWFKKYVLSTTQKG